MLDPSLPFLIQSVLGTIQRNHDCFHMVTIFTP